MSHIKTKPENRVAVEYVAPAYPQTPPFHPDTRYPEYDGPLGETNEVYAGVRQLFRDLGFDVARYGTKAWNPLGDIIKPGQQVLIKPSIVLHRNIASLPYESVVTHGSLVRAVTDYALKALNGTGRLVIGDAPVQQCDFDLANEKSGVQGVVNYYGRQGINIDLLDFRFVVSNHGKSGQRVEREGDTAGFTLVNLAQESMHRQASELTEKFAPTHYDAPDWLDRLRVTNYDPAFMQRHHNASKHEYIIANTALESDVVISLPKLKTHRKVGLTVCLKNLIGINGHKDCLPHHKQGSIEEGGDEYLKKSLLKTLHTKIQEFEDVQTSKPLRYAIKVPKRILFKIIKKVADDPYFEGSWWGNDTLWRTVLDINRILLFWNTESKQLEEKPQRVFLSIVDGIVAGEKEGPLQPSARKAGILMAGLNAALVDRVCAYVVGFDWRKLPLLKKATEHLAAEASEQDSIWSGGNAVTQDALIQVRLVPPRGWQGHIELPR